MKLGRHSWVPTLCFVLLLAPLAAGQDIIRTETFEPAIEQDSGEIWTYRISPGANPVAMAIHDRGLFLAGSFYSPPILGPGNETADIPGPEGVDTLSTIVFKYDDGVEWSRAILDEFMTPAAVAVDDTSIYLAGYVNDLHHELFVARYDDGPDEVIWQQRFSIEGPPFVGPFHFLKGLAVNDSGVYVSAWNAGSTGELRKYSLDGELLWTNLLSEPGEALWGTYGASGQGVVVDDGGVYAWDGEAVSKYTSDGALIWTSDPGVGSVLAVDNLGVYVAGDSLWMMDTDGKLLWEAPVDSAAGVASVTPDPLGIYVAGSTSGALPSQCQAGGSDSFVSMYSRDGDAEWTRQFGTASHEYTGGLAVTFGSVYVTGRGYPGAFLTTLMKAPPAIDDSRPYIWHECVVNAASYIGGGVAPGELVTIFGVGIGPVELVAADLQASDTVGTALAGTRVLFNGIAAPMLYASATQSAAIVPYGIEGSDEVDVEVESAGSRSTPVTLPVFETRPGLFSLDGSGTGQAAVINEDGTVNSPANPAPRGSVIWILATGEGQTEPAGTDGVIHSGPGPTPRAGVQLFFFDSTLEDESDIDWEPEPKGWTEVEPMSAGGTTGAVAGLLVVGVRLPDFVESGAAVESRMSIGGLSAQEGMTFAVK